MPTNRRRGTGVRLRVLLRCADTRVQHEGSTRRFNTRVQHEGSTRRFNTKVQHEGSTRRFNTKVQHEGSTRGFVRVLRIEPWVLFRAREIDDGVPVKAHEAK